MGAVVAWLAGLLRVFWVCRVSLLDALVGVLFFWQIVQAQNLMADLSSMGNGFAEFFFWSGVFGFTGLLWAFPVHYGARRSLDQLTRMAPVVAKQQYWLILGLPRVLGLMPFAALAFGINGARVQASGAADVLPMTAGVTMTQGFWLYVADGAAAAVFALFVWQRTKWIPASWTGWFLHPLAIAATAAIFLACYIAPLQASILVPRALLVPPLFGSLVLGASWLTRAADRTGFPFLATLALILGVLTGFNVDFNNLRTLKIPVEDQRLDIEVAVKAWKAANDCASPGQSCPHPIVVAIDGGASRAAFTAATFVGELLDSMPPPKAKTAADPGEAQTPGRRIFAISGVSGGAYGAAVIQSALLDAQRGGGDGTAPPCRSAQTTWFGYATWHGSKDKTFKWIDCLQALTSGDYLSSTIIGLAFRDLAAPPWQRINLPAMADRAAILEMTWERQYSATLGPGATFYEGGDRCRDENDESGLCRRAAHAGRYLVDGHWMPMLLLNSTSVTTGRRVISSDLRSTRAKLAFEAPIQTGGPLYSQAFDLREAMSPPCPSNTPPVAIVPATGPTVLAKASADGNDARTLTNGVCAAPGAVVNGPDVRLSTAALTSARFPIVSPAGIYRMQGSPYGDQVVDGGYFENSGLTTALDIVHALHDSSGLDATVVSISNNPAYDPPDATQEKECQAQFGGPKDAAFSPAQCTGLPRRPAITPLVPPSDNTFLSRFFALFYRPFQTLVATGDGHADELMALIAMHPPGGKFYHLQVAVAPRFDPPDGYAGPAPLADAACDRLKGKHMKMAEVSMSWWLSAAAQADLDVQRCAWPNRVELSKLVGGLAERR